MDTGPTDPREGVAELAEMLGLIRGVLADGSISSAEATHLTCWVQAHPSVVARWPGNVLTQRLTEIFRDGRMDARERARLSDLLARIASNSTGASSPAFSTETDLPLSRPAPVVRFEGRTFVLAGEMRHGPHSACAREITELGGRCDRSVSRRTDYVVIGGSAAGDWFQTGFRDVLDDVVRYRARAVEIAVISEDHWVRALP